MLRQRHSVQATTDLKGIHLKISHDHSSYKRTKSLAFELDFSKVLLTTTPFEVIWMSKDDTDEIIIMIYNRATIFGPHPVGHILVTFNRCLNCSACVPSKVVIRAPDDYTPHTTMPRFICCKKNVLLDTPIN